MTARCRPVRSVGHSLQHPAVHVPARAPSSRIAAHRVHLLRCQQGPLLAVQRQRRHIGPQDRCALAEQPRQFLRIGGHRQRVDDPVDPRVGVARQVVAVAGVQLVGVHRRRAGGAAAGRPAGAGEQHVDLVVAQRQRAGGVRGGVLHGDTRRRARLRDRPDRRGQPGVRALVADAHGQRPAVIAARAASGLATVNWPASAAALGGTERVLGRRVEPRVGDRHRGVAGDHVARRAQRQRPTRRRRRPSGPAAAKMSCSMPADGLSVRT